MKKYNLKDLIDSRITKHLTIVFAGNIFAAGLGFFSVLMISKALSVSDFGLFNIALSLMFITRYLSNLGMNTSMIKFASSYLGKKKIDKANEVFMAALLVRTIAGTALAFIIYFSAAFLSEKIFHIPALKTLIRLSSLGILSYPLLNHFKSVLFSHKQFKDGIFLQITVDAIKIMVLAMLFLIAKINVATAIGVFAVVPVAGIALGLFKMKGTLISSKRPGGNILKHLLSYSKWTFTSNVCNRIFRYASIFMIAKMIDSRAAGIYGLAINLTYIFPILILSVTSVLLPEVSRFIETEQFRKYIKTSLKISAILSVPAVLFLFISNKIIIGLFGSRYQDSTIIFNWLLLSYIFIAFTAPIRSALYSLHRPRIMAIVDIIKVLLMLIGCYFFIPTRGVLAPAILALIINLCAFVYFTVYIFGHLWKEKIKVYDEDMLQNLEQR